MEGPSWQSWLAKEMGNDDIGKEVWQWVGGGGVLRPGWPAEKGFQAGGWGRRAGCLALQGAEGWLPGTPGASLLAGRLASHTAIQRDVNSLEARARERGGERREVADGGGRGGRRALTQRPDNGSR